MERSFREELRHRVETAMAELQVPGVAVGIIEDGDEVVETFGDTSIDHPLPVDEHTLFQIGSTTKTFTATLLMQEVEAGRLDLDAPVRRYLPGLHLERDEWSDALQVRHLLTHSGGFDGDWFLVHQRGEDDRLSSVIDAMPQVPAQVPPGAAYAYSNAGFAVAGRLVEVLAGDDQSFEELVAERVFRLLGMTRSFHRAHDLLLHRYVAGHLVRDGQIEIARPWHLVRSAAAHGGIVADVRDQLRWLRFQLGDGEGLLRPEVLRSMQSRQIEGGSNCAAVGYAWMLEEVDGTEVWRHGGETNGHMCGFKFVPDRNFGITVMTNASSGIRLHEELIDWVFAERLGLSATRPASAATPELSSLLGRYGGMLRDVVLTSRDGELWVELQIHQRDGRPKPLVTPPTVARFTSDRTFVTEGPLVGEGNCFASIGGEPGPWLRWDGRLLKRTGAS